MIADEREWERFFIDEFLMTFDGVWANAK